MKPTVHYKPTQDDIIVVGQSAFVQPVDHPDSSRVSNTTWVRTSTVIRKEADGTFETRNTVYVPL